MVDVLTQEERRIMAYLQSDAWKRAREHDRLSNYYEGEQRLQHLGIAVPNEFRDFQVVVNVPRMAVDEPVKRQMLKSFQRAGSAQADAGLRAAWEGNNLDSQSVLVHRDARTFGRAFVTVSEDPDDADMPRIQVESPAAFNVVVDHATRRVSAALRTVQDKYHGTSRTLFLPDQTVQLVHNPLVGWEVAERAEHGLGVVPVVTFLNRPRSGHFGGTSEMADVIGMTDSIARILTNMQVAVESHGIPRGFMTGVARGDFVDANGKPIPQWEAYFNAIHTVTNPQGKIGQLTASDLKNFETAQAMYAREMSQATGFPADYFGMTSVNPPAEGTIRGAEARLIRRTEAENVEVGMTLGWAMATAYQFSTGRKVDGNRVRVDWHDPATPTVAQRMDAVVKAKQSGILSREGSWDELGWSEARKARERAYFAQEASDPDLQVALGLLSGNAN